MTITFRCEKCHKSVEAPDSAAGSRGKCPYCKHSSYIPLPAEERAEIPLVEIDEEEERRRQEMERSLFDQERELLCDVGGQPEKPLEFKEDLRSEDLQHFVVNYCMDMFNAKLERAELHVKKLKRFKFTAVEAIENLQSGKATEDILKVIPKKVLKGYLTELKDRLA